MHSEWRSYPYDREGFDVCSIENRQKRLIFEAASRYFQFDFLFTLSLIAIGARLCQWDAEPEYYQKANKKLEPCLYVRKSEVVQPFAKLI